MSWRIAVAAVLVAACDAGGDEPVAVVRDTVDGVPVVRNLAPESVGVWLGEGLSLDTVWSSDEVFQPRGVVVLDERRVMVVDRDRLFVVSDTLVAVLGRPGDGPGEFRAIAGAAAIGDTVFVTDQRHRRLTVMRMDGMVVRTVPLVSPVPHAGMLEPSRPIPLSDGALVLAWREGLVRVDGGRDTVMLAPFKPGDTTVTAVPLRMADTDWLNPGTMIIPRQAYGPRAMHTASASGVAVVADGVAYAYEQYDFAAGARLRVERSWRRRPADFESLPGAALANANDMRREAIRLYETVQESGAERGSIAQLWIDGDARVWVRPVNDDYRHHPVLENFVPGILARERYWEVLSAAGELIGWLTLPHGFAPSDSRGCVIHGLARMEDGTQALAIVRVPRLCAG